MKRKIFIPTNTSGLTLGEIVVVIVILGVLATIALPRYDTMAERMRSKEGANVLPTILAAQKRYELDNGTPATTLSQLDLTFPGFEHFNAPTINAVSGGGANIQRNGAAPKNYTLQINSIGTITCSGSSLCSKMGY